MPFFLYGHYDSRGGATLIEADTKEVADFRYIDQWFHEPDEDAGVEDKPHSHIIEEDFIGEVTFTAHREVESGEDLEYGEYSDKAQAFEEGLQWATDEIQDTTANPYQELLWARYEDDQVVALRLGAPGENPSHKAEPDWRRSHLGEDAFGVLLLKK